jgi:hypothetical protein
VRISSQRLAKLVDRSIELLLLRKRDTQIIVDPRNLSRRAGPQSQSKLCERGLDTVGLHQDIPQVVMRSRIVRP